MDPITPTGRIFQSMDGGVPVVVVTELFRGTGGVQVFSRRLIEAMDELFGSPVPVISRNDRRSDCPAEFLEGRKFWCAGSLPVPLRRIQVVAACVLSGAPSILAAHPYFTRWLRYQRKLLGIPYLTVAHGIDVWNLKGTATAAGLLGAECVLPVSDFTGRRIAEQMDPAPRFEVFPNTFDASVFRPSIPSVPWKQRLGIGPSRKVMLTVCRLDASERRKGYDRVLEAMPELVTSYPDLVWILAGKGSDLPRVKARAAELGVAGHCRFTGFVDDAELPDLYRSSDLFVLPSLKEGFGIVFLEAAACGIPVIAGNRDGSVDALANGALGTLIDPEDRESLVSAIRGTLFAPGLDRLALHDECVARFGKAAFRRRLRDIFCRYPSLLRARKARPGHAIPAS